MDNKINKVNSKLVHYVWSLYKDSSVLNVALSETCWKSDNHIILLIFFIGPSNMEKNFKETCVLSQYRFFKLQLMAFLFIA